jgi:uncharacterized SAM-binding protein YcdF (DUF218 family)
MPALMRSDVIIVLAGGIRVTGALPQSVLLRIKTAHKLFQQNRASRILMAGKWSLFLKQTPPMTEAAAMAKYALSLGVPKKNLLKEEQSNNTTSNVFYIWKNFLKPNQWHKLIVVTTDSHLHRTKYIFDWLLGSDYQIEYVASPAKGDLLIRFKRWLNENLQLYLTRRFLATVPQGGVEKLAEKYRNQSTLAAHPMYLFLKRFNRNQAAFFLKLLQVL